MKGKRGNSGFTMAELLIVIAIIAVLSGVSFVVARQQQRNLERRELDSIAQQIFVAAQNHLTMAKNENYLGVGKRGYGEPAKKYYPDPEDTSADYLTSEDDSEDTSVYYLTSDNFGPDKLLDQMLPFGSIDEMVRGGGSYIICYQPEAARVVDVFYSDKGVITDQVLNDKAKLVGEGNSTNRRDYTPMLGWYGSDPDNSAIIGVANGQWLEQPRIRVINAERLLVEVTDMNNEIKEGTICLKLIVKGVTTDNGESAPVKVLTINGTAMENRDARVTPSTDPETNNLYYVTLDDITTTGMHFSELDSTFVPGQDIIIQAEAFYSDKLANIAKSDEERTNSLFARVYEDKDGILTADINNIRHLENLSEAVSDLNVNDITFKLEKAVQTSDLSWNTFVDRVNHGVAEPEGAGEEGAESAEESGEDGSSEATTGVQIQLVNGTNPPAGTFMPVNPDYALTYDGQGYNISGVKIEYAKDAGLFGSLNIVGTEISNLALIDFQVTSTGMAAGALAGSAVGSAEKNIKVSNVLAYNRDSMDAKINAVGDAGGLIGVTTNCTLENSAAALVVASSAGNAGGLVGTTEKGTVTACYSGGHTVTDEDTGAVLYSAAQYNVTGAAKAGGLIGDAGDTTIEYSYSTCSASGATAGGLVGSAEGDIKNSYCTGLVNGTNVGAFAGTLSSMPDEDDNCTYFEIINEDLKAVGGSDSEVITPFDATVASYEAFVGAASGWQSAYPYNSRLVSAYSAGYNLQTVFQLKGDTATAKSESGEESSESAESESSESGENETTNAPKIFVEAHYGDWPVPEIFVFNEKKDNTAS